MPITVVQLRRGVGGNTRWSDFTVNFDSSYPTGGEAIAASDWVKIGGHGMTAAKCQMFSCETDVSGNSVALDRTNDKLLLFTAAAEAASTSNQSAITIRCRAWFDNQMG